MAAGLQLAQGDSALSLAAQGAGTVTSGQIAASGTAAYVMLGVHCTAITGTTPTLNVSLEESATGTGAWTAVPNSGPAQITAAGNAVAFAAVSKSFVRVTATVGGTTPSVTANVAVLVFAE